MALRCVDLMLGDWVMLYDRPRKVERIYDYGRVEAGCVEEDCDKLEPIPLTPEILEKNFTSTNNMFGFKNYEIGKGFILENRGERFCLSRIFFGHKYSTFYITDIFSIHQLQHALRLCGIEKEIVI